jgi:tetratricopeptide (TPR) repeat protein
VDLRRLKEQASRLIAEGRYERAEVLYRQLLTISPRDSALWLKHAELLKRLERTAPAIASYRMAAQLLMEFGHANRAIAALKIALELQPEDVELVSDIIRYELRQRQRSREMPAVVAEEAAHPVAPSELHALSETAPPPAPTPLLALPMLAASESRITAMVAEVTHTPIPPPRASVPRIPIEVESPLHPRWPQVRRVSDTEVAVKPSPFAHWVVLSSAAPIDVRFFDEYAVPEEAHWLEEPTPEPT